MRRLIRLVVIPLVPAFPLLPGFSGESKGADPAHAAIAATVETTLATGGEQIRQFAFDGDPATFFASEKSPVGEDHFTLVLDRPAVLKSVAAATGRPDGGDSLEAGTLEASADGKTFREIGRFEGGKARGEPKGEAILAVRIHPAGAQKHPLVVRELAIESEPQVALFKYPIEIKVDVTDAPDMKEWAERVARICERAYPMINDELRSDGFRPRHLVTMRLRSDYNGVAATGGGRITGSVKFFKAHPDDVGAMVHETVHVAQAYRSRSNPGWLVEGVADYVRFFKFEPGKLRPPSPERARFNGSYKVTAQFLAYVSEKYDRELVRKLNAVMREGKYREEVWKDLTGKTAEELDREWRATLGPRRGRF